MGSVNVDVDGVIERRADGGPAFPCTVKEQVNLFNRSGEEAGTSEVDWPYEGMTLRDYYAGQGLPEALRDFLNANRRFPETNAEREAIALRVYAMSDALLKVRDQ